MSLFILSQLAAVGDGPWRHGPPHFAPFFLLLPLSWLFFLTVAVFVAARLARPR